MIIEAIPAPGPDRRQMLGALAALPLALAPAVALAQTAVDTGLTGRALAEAARRLYHDARIGAATADRIEQAMGSGRLDGAGTAESLAERLNAEIAAVSGDGHFMIMAGDMHGQPVLPTPPHQPPPPLRPDELTHLRRVNFGIAAAELLPGNVARLDLRHFYRPTPEVRDRLAAAMTLLADSWGFILDLSRNIGGDAHSVALLLSYFFERPPFVVNRFRWRNLPAESYSTTASPGGPLYGEARPLVVLVSRQSFSAAEEFAYDVQALRRGLVVGETTGGGANHALPVSIAGGFTAFIPQARAENPVTGTNWEGVGVRPDISAAGEAALRTAHLTALERIAAGGDAERARAVRQVLTSMTADTIG